MYRRSGPLGANNTHQYRRHTKSSAYHLPRTRHNCIWGSAGLFGSYHSRTRFGQSSSNSGILIGYKNPCCRPHLSQASTAASNVLPGGAGSVPVIALRATSQWSGRSSNSLNKNGKTMGPIPIIRRYDGWVIIFVKDDVCRVALFHFST